MCDENITSGEIYRALALCACACIPEGGGWGGEERKIDLPSTPQSHLLELAIDRSRFKKLDKQQCKRKSAAGISLVPGLDWTLRS